MANLDFRKTAGKNALVYAKRTDFFALVCKGAATTPIKIVTSEGFTQSLKECRASFSQTEDGIRWKGLQANKARVCGLVKTVELPHGWRDFPEDCEGFRSTAHEQELTEALNRIRFLGHSWEHTGRTMIDGKWGADITSEDGTLTIEVKGPHGRIF